MIVKPRRGGGSRGVRRANDGPSLERAVAEVEYEGNAKHGIVIERYANGPEVDANFALWDGEILFFEISDDFPCLGDAENATLSDNFAEDISALPSQLAPEEQDLIRSSLHRTLLLMGFRSGVFHVEARVQYSAMHFQQTDGILDLTYNPACKEHRHEPEVFLLEVNPRPAGPQSVFATTYTYGVDFYALQWLRVLSDGKRFAALSHPFTSYAQYESSILNIPIHRDNIHVPKGYLTHVLQKIPGITPNVSRAECYTPGRTVSQKGGAGFLACFLLYSRTNRRSMLEMCEKIKRVSRDLLDESM